MKSVVSVTCANCGTKYRTTFRKGGRKPARTCPACNSDQFVLTPTGLDDQNDTGSNLLDDGGRQS
jgi:transcription elongation factor Elf1